MGFARYSMQDNQGHRVPGSNDRRRTCRYRVLFQDALIGWPEGSSFIQVPARLLDLSLAGCMLELPKRPARTARQPIWVRSLADSSETWVEGVVRFVRKPLMKRCRIRIAFCDQFPYESFKKLVYGTADFHTSIRDPAPPHEQDHYWK
jgi:hypothetical protein